MAEKAANSFGKNRRGKKEKERVGEGIRGEFLYISFARVNDKKGERSMKIGVTERGDAGIDFRWVPKLDEVDGAILITKNITDKFIKKAVTCTKPVIIHCTCTGWGGTEMEPNVPDYRTQLTSLSKLLQTGFPAERCVLRIDPIFPTENGMKMVHEVLNFFDQLNTGIERIRISVVDEYKHVKERYAQHGWKPIYDGFSANDEQLKLVIENLDLQPHVFEICAENRLYQLAKEKYPCLFTVRGCVSRTDLELMKIPPEKMDENPQGRVGCHCLSCKTELLTRKVQCPNKCVYCYWH